MNKRFSTIFDRSAVWTSQEFNMISPGKARC